MSTVPHVCPHASSRACMISPSKPVPGTNSMIKAYEVPSYPFAPRQEDGKAYIHIMCISLRIKMRMYMHVYVYIYIYISIFLFLCICTYVHEYVCISIYIYIYINIHIRQAFGPGRDRVLLFFVLVCYPLYPQGRPRPPFPAGLGAPWIP